MRPLKKEGPRGSRPLAEAPKRAERADGGDDGYGRWGRDSLLSAGKNAPSPAARQAGPPPPPQSRGSEAANAPGAWLARLGEGPRAETRAARPSEDAADWVAGYRSPSRDSPSVLGSGSEPAGEGYVAGPATSPSGIARPFSLAAGAPSTWHLLRGRPGRDERGRCPTATVGKDLEALLFLKSLLQLQGGGVGHWYERKDLFVCFHGSFQKPPFLL